MKETSLVDVRKKLGPYRRQIDAIDDGIVRLLGKRYAVVRKVAEYKIKNDVRIVQNDRVREVKERNAKTAQKHGVSPDLVRTLYALIIDEAHVIEHAMKSGTRKKNSVAPRLSRGPRGRQAVL